MKSVFLNSDVLAVEKKIMKSLKISSLVLMENAGMNSARFILDNFKEALRLPVIILAGKGSNAGDGFVIARQLANNDVEVKVLLLYPAKTLKGDAKINYDILINSESPLIDILDCKSPKDFRKTLEESSSWQKQLVVDAIFGIGFKGKLDKSVAGIVSELNKAPDKIVIAIDTPSGLENYGQSAEPVKAKYTLSMGIKKFHSMFYKGREYSGINNVMGIGVPDYLFGDNNKKKIYEIEAGDVKPYIPRREVNSYKYTNGKVFVLAGARGFTGAAFLCSMAALRTGSGAVQIGVPESLDPIMEALLADVTKVMLPETPYSSFSLDGKDEINEKVKWSDVTLIGPGISKNEETLELVREIVSENSHPFVIDADGIIAFKGHTKLLKKKNGRVILTPHFGEFSSLLGIPLDELKANFREIARDFARKHNVILVLKNSPTIITEGENTYINPTGRENLATVGTGDVLAGMTASLYAQTGDALHSAISGTYMHGQCGDILYTQTGGSSTIASDLIDVIPEIKISLSYIR